MRYYSSTAGEKTLSSAITTSSTSITLSDLTGLPASYPYTLVLDPDTASEEIVLVTSLSSGSTLNVTRGTDTYQGVAGGNGTAKQAHDSGAKVKHMITARDLQEPQDHINASQGVHGIDSGDSVVGATTAATLENKTISSSNNTISISSSAISDWSTQFNLKADKASPTFTGTVTATGATSVALPSNTSIGSVDSTELGYLNGVTSAIQTQLDAKQPLDSDLTAVAGLSTNGIVVRTGSGTAATRTLVAGSGITLTNADGVSGNITIAASAGGTGTVTSVGMTVPTGLSVSGSPITTSGTLAVSLASGYSIPTTTKQANWDVAYNGRYVSVYTGSALSPTSDGVLTYNSESADSSNFHSTSSNTSRIVIPSNLDGKYKLDAFVNITCGGSTGDFNVYLTKNGTEISGTRGKARLGTTGDAQTISVSTIVSLAATDYVEVYLDIPGSSGATHSVISGFNANFVGA